MASQTALVSAFARAYHARENTPAVFVDPLAGRMLTQAEYAAIAENMQKGAGFFCPDFSGSPQDTLRAVVDTYLSPTPVGRAAFIEDALKTAVRAGARQYVILGAGYDTFAWRRPDWAKDIAVFELDLPDTQEDKRARLARAGLQTDARTHLLPCDLSLPDPLGALRGHPSFDARAITLCALPGLVYYMEEAAFARLARALGALLPKGSALAFDYPDDLFVSPLAGPRAQKQALLAKAAGEPMRAGYGYPQMERLLASAGFLIYEHLDPAAVTARFFASRSACDPTHPMTAFDNTAYCLAVRGDV